ncbi:hypothetical protein R9C00_29015 [Flammeovirgaceae bacterium SG7u.111]|nr:hypothetical protein [Flammeovirgaceae bacterium SG7u.132]WPO35741.1 hypothetical protein R9C00_29015 [Flammeovirgaceae bacterium SG7u.111]
MRSVYKKIIIAVFLGMGFLQVRAQGEDSCQVSIRNAETNYKNGRLYQIINLKDCINYLSSREQKARAYYLLFKAYAHTDQDSLADLAMSDFLRHDPNYNASGEDNKFRYFSQKFINRPYEIAFFGGVNFNVVSNGNRGTSYLFGVSHSNEFYPELFFTKSLKITQRINDQYSAKGKERWLVDNGNEKGFIDEFTAPVYGELSLGLKHFPFHRTNKWNFFYEGGIAFNLIIGNRFNEAIFHIFETEEGDTSDPALIYEEREPQNDVEIEPVFNVAPYVGAGFRRELETGKLELGLRVQSNLIRQEYSYDMRPLLMMTGYEHEEFRSVTTELVIGYVINRYRIKKFQK